MQHRSWFTPIRIAAILLLLVGAGNLYIGMNKRDRHEAAIQSAARDSEESQQPEDSLKLKRLHSRMSFYEFVITGGGAFLVAGAGLLIFAQLKSRKR